MSEKKSDEKKRIASNRRASYEYHLTDKFEAGMVLLGTEVKSMREGGVNLVDSFVDIKNGEAWLKSLYVAPFEKGNRNNHEPTRPRKLLLHHQEIEKLTRGLEEKGLTIVPLELYFDRGIAKCRIALARGKKLHDKRDDIHSKDAKREIDRAVKAAREGR
jgi:SsrA-binding protein